MLFLETKDAGKNENRKLFWTRSFGVLGRASNRVLLGATLFTECAEQHSFHSASDSIINGINKIGFTRNAQNMRSFGFRFGGKIARGHP